MTRFLTRDKLIWLWHLFHCQGYRNWASKNINKPSKYFLCISQATEMYSSGWLCVLSPILVFCSKQQTCNAVNVLVCFFRYYFFMHSHKPVLQWRFWFAFSHIVSYFITTNLYSSGWYRLLSLCFFKC